MFTDTLVENKSNETNITTSNGTLGVITNRVSRELFGGWELTDKEREEFDYMDNIEEGTFFRYKGWVYDLGNVMRIDSWISKYWDGILNESFFSGILVKIADDGESVIIGRYCS